jgi:protease-4
MKGLKMIRRFRFQWISLLAALLFVSGCAVKLKLFTDETDPLEEYKLEGSASEKILLIPVEGIILDRPEKDLFRRKGGMVQEIVARLRLAEKDKAVKAVVFKIDSPGGSATASDILYHEIMEYKDRTRAPVVVAMMDVAASGGYYISLAADHIVAHPTTITGSVGVITLYPRVDRMMEKIGLDVEVSKSGENKDMVSPFREPTQQERLMLQQIVRSLGQRFIGLVERNRKLSRDSLQTVSTARIFLPEEALKLGLVDQIGYMSDAISKAKSMADLPEDARVVVYRRTRYPNDTLYNTGTAAPGTEKSLLVDLNVFSGLSPLALRTGFYYLWLPAGSY